ncbi:MAG: preprotein translocase subunit SecA [SAR86 cluster bacterium]|mgnify:FL=1|nr:preprotein translocase subunit SecA [Candidatus Pseudothioglobus aerophilus]MDO7577360.1 preprotein translocase subunit SecA [SAR86 cluster bacterium]MDP0595285.1 preprotein translocase subunit SecA [Candidatus Thioglobus sp.]
MSIINNVLSKVLGSHNDRLIKKYNGQVSKINSLEEKMRSMSDDELVSMTEALKERLNNKESMESILAESFAVVREASQRVLGLRHYDVQLIGGMVLNEGSISEMGTGEGKTLVATLPAYLNALSGKGVHIVTVNDYLAKRDSEWMGKVFSFLGLSVGTVFSGMSGDEKQAAYSCDITYATNNELGFDYLRDNMAFSQEQKTQKKLAFAIIDEVDSILIDEARTPLVISGPTGDHAEVYIAIDKMIPSFTLQTEVGEGKEVEIIDAGDYTLDEKHKQVFLTDDGHIKAEDMLIEAGALAPESSLYDSSNIILMQHLLSGLRAHVLFKKNIDYLVKDDEVVIVDEFTGRTMEGRRWSEGLHQAIEAKENVSIKKENQTLASITYQNYFRLYEKLSGMTGTAETEASELQDIYGLEVVVVPPNTISSRIDHSDLIYGTMNEKLDAVMKDIQACQKIMQPVLVGTNSIESSESVSALLTKNKIKHEVLNAKQHQREAEIIANAGAPGAVTISTNMAGRGTDIVLGGRPLEGASEAETESWKAKHQSVIDSGGLHIIGTERNESRRVDNQLRGRSGRQGDIGSTRFYLSLEDSLMKIFASEKTASMMKKLGMKEGEALEHSWLNKTIANAQKKVEGMHYDARKHLLEYDDVANDQRKVVYQLRDELMGTEDVKERYENIRDGVISDLFFEYISPKVLEADWDVGGLESALALDYSSDIPVQKSIDEGLNVDQVLKMILEGFMVSHKVKETAIGSETMRTFEKAVMLKALDHHWKDHLAVMDQLRQSVNLRGYGQKNPVQEYKRESFSMFTVLLDTINSEMVKALCSLNIENIEQVKDQLSSASSDMEGQETNSPSPAKKPTAPRPRVIRQPSKLKVGRNDPCPCGSGKKYKQCHG